MQAVVYTEYGRPDVLRLADVPIPTPRDDEVLVEMRATSLNRSDWETLLGTPLYARVAGLRRPRRHILGSDIAGQVAAVGRRVTSVVPGDDVFADALFSKGGFAEFVCVAEQDVAPLPSGLSYEEAAAVPQAGAIALQGIRDDDRVRPGASVLINGAGGGSGMYAIQLAKLAGAEVTGVDTAAKLGFMRSLGADHVIDYTREDFTTTGRTYDVILDLVAERSVFDYRRALRPGGRYKLVGGSMSTMLQVMALGPVIARRGRRSIGLLGVHQGADRVGPLVELIREGQVSTTIDRRYRLHEVPEALRYVGEGHAKGKVVVVP